MSTQELAQSISVRAGADLSTKQFCFVNLTQSSGVTDTPNGVAVATIPASAGGHAAGVLLNKPTAGEAATVQIGGIAKVIAAGAINAGGPVQTNTDGHALAAVSGDYVIGIAMEDAVDDDVISVLLVSKFLIP